MRFQWEVSDWSDGADVSMKCLVRSNGEACIPIGKRGEIDSLALGATLRSRHRFDTSEN